GAHVPGQGDAADLLGHSPGAVAVQVEQDALGAARRQPAGHRGADAARRSGDECNSAHDAPGAWWWVRISYAVTVGDRGSRTAGRGSGVGHAVGGGEQGGGGVAEPVGPLPRGLALAEAGVDALHDDRELEVAERDVEAQLAGVAAGDLGVAGG